MLKTSVGQILINSALPPAYRDYTRALDKGSLTALLDRIAKDDPDTYVDVVQKLQDIGRDGARQSGGYPFTLEDLKEPDAMREARAEIEAKLQTLDSREDLSPAERSAAVLDIMKPYQQTLASKIYKELLAKNNPLAKQVLSGSRGNAGQLKTLVGGDLLYVDNEGKEIPVPVLSSYAKGLSPMEYFAGAFGTRQGAVQTKLSVASGGFFGKQLQQLTHRMLVTANDEDTPYDESSPRGLPTDVDDPDNIGAYLSHPVGGYARNTEITAKVLKDLKRQGVKRLLVRSPLVGGPPDGGVFAYDLGRRERGALTPVGTFVGSASGSALSEPVTQSALGGKHSGGVSKGEQVGRGFSEINAMIQAPQTFPGAATHADADGQVTSVEVAPQGGHYVLIGNQKHYVGADLEVTVRPGDTVEAGDLLSTGTPHPTKLIEHKGIGEGSRQFLEAFRNTLTRNSVKADRRNLELLARGLSGYVELTDELGDYSPDEVVPYWRLAASWQPREGHAVKSPKAVAGQFLEQPVLHYTIGTQLKPSVVKMLQEYGVDRVVAHPDPPPFKPAMIRAMEHIAYDPDPFTRLLGSYQTKSLTQAAQTGAVSDEASTSYVPSLMRGVSFGRVGPIANVSQAPSMNPQQLEPAAASSPSADTLLRPEEKRPSRWSLQNLLG